MLAGRSVCVPSRIISRGDLCVCHVLQQRCPKGKIKVLAVAHCRELGSTHFSSWDYVMTQGIRNKASIGVWQWRVVLASDVPAQRAAGGPQS